MFVYQHLTVTEFSLWGIIGSNLVFIDWNLWQTKWYSWSWFREEAWLYSHQSISLTSYKDEIRPDVFQIYHWNHVMSGETLICPFIHVFHIYHWDSYIIGTVQISCRRKGFPNNVFEVEFKAVVLISSQRYMLLHCSTLIKDKNHQCY